MTPKEQEKYPKATEVDFGCCLTNNDGYSGANSTGFQNINIIQWCRDVSLEAEVWYHNLTFNTGPFCRITQSISLCLIFIIC